MNCLKKQNTTAWPKYSSITHWLLISIRLYGGKYSFVYCNDLLSALRVCFLHWYLVPQPPASSLSTSLRCQAQPFLLWWRPALSGSQFQLGHKMNSDLPVCLFISCVFQVQRVCLANRNRLRVTAWRESDLLKNKTDRKWSCLDLGHDVSCY